MDEEEAMQEPVMRGSLRLSQLAGLLREYGYEVTGPENDERELVVTLQGNHPPQLSAPPALA
jgi:hypothetical protein